MTFSVSGDAYDHFMGRYSLPLAPLFADWAAVEPGQTLLDVGCGSGILTQELAARVGPGAVSAIDPSPLVEACMARLPDADVRQGAAEELPWPDGSFDVVLAQLVIHFLDDPVAGLVEMRRVVRAGGVVAACSWNFPEMQMLDTFWGSVREVEPAAVGERFAYNSPEGMGELGADAGLEEVETTSLEVENGYADFDELWSSFMRGVGPGGEYLVSVPEKTRAAIREEYFRRIGEPSGAFTLTARASAVRGRAPK
jgi:ubiquinone/menaquinone biosynthesis C-methylase UbiE